MTENSLVYDILKEIFNIGVGKAADMLSEVINKKILLNVPSISIVDYHQSDKKFDVFFGNQVKGTLMVSSISFGEKINGEANLIFPADKMREVINFCTQEENNSKINELNFTDIDFDIIRELGNIILNSIVGEIGNFLSFSLEYTLPNVKLFNSIDFEEDIINRENTYLLVLSISFIIDDTEIEGAVIISLSINSLNELLKVLKKMEDELYG